MSDKVIVALFFALHSVLFFGFAAYIAGATRDEKGMLKYVYWLGFAIVAAIAVAFLVKALIV